MQCHFLNYYYNAPITPDKILVSSGTINPPYWIKSLPFLLKLILGFTNARDRYLLFREISRDDCPWWNKVCVIRTRLILPWWDPWVNNWPTFVEQAEAIKSSSTIRVGTYSGLSKSGTPSKNETFFRWCGASFSLWQHTIFSNTVLQS